MRRRKITGIKIELSVNSLAPLGDATGFFENKICFVKGAVPGEKVVATVIKEDKKNIYATLDTVIEPSPNRAAPLCSVADLCGGCKWQHIQYNTQAEEKKIILQRIFSLENINFVKSNPFAYRRLARLHFKGRKHRPAIIGFFKQREHTIVDINSCPVLEKKLSNAIDILKNDLFFSTELSGEIQLSAAMDGLSVHLKTDQLLSENFYKHAKTKVPSDFLGITALSDNILSVIAGSSTLSVELDDKTALKMPAGSFGQANSYINCQIINDLQKQIKELGSIKNCLEIFAGAGNFTVFIAPLVSKLTTIEYDKTACSLAEQNMKDAGLFNVCTKQQDASLISDNQLKNIDLAVLDPPRTGNILLAEKLSKSNVKNIIYISCNPKTLKRDISILESGGYKINNLTGYDMFPQTPHIESMALLSR